MLCHQGLWPRVWVREAHHVLAAQRCGKRLHQARKHVELQYSTTQRCVKSWHVEPKAGVASAAWYAGLLDRALPYPVPNIDPDGTAACRSIICTGTGVTTVLYILIQPTVGYKMNVLS